MNRDTQLKSIRPAIPSIVDVNASSLAESFQNQCLRPVLKLQNSLLIRIYRQYIDKRKGVFYTLPENKQKIYLRDSLQRDLKFRNFLIGIVCGHFTLEEWEIYQSAETELRKRLLTLLVQRLESQIDLLAKPEDA